MHFQKSGRQKQGPRAKIEIVSFRLVSKTRILFIATIHFLHRITDRHFGGIQPRSENIEILKGLHSPSHPG